MENWVPKKQACGFGNDPNDIHNIVSNNYKQKKGFGNNAKNDATYSQKMTDSNKSPRRFAGGKVRLDIVRKI